MCFPLLAAAGDVWTVLAGIVFFAIWAINHFISAAKVPPPHGRKQPRKPLAPERPLRPKPPSQGTSQAELNAEIEQFLKRAGEQRGAQGRREPALAAPPKAPPRPPRERRPSGQKRDFDSVAESVEKHLGTRSFNERTEHLADDITRADQQMEDHLQKAFNRRVGTLDEATPKAAVPTTDDRPLATIEQTSAAAAIAGLLTTPSELRKAIVLNEILDRPEHRW